MIRAARAAFAELEARTEPAAFQRAQQLALAYYVGIAAAFPPPDSLLVYGDATATAADAGGNGVRLLFRPDVPYPRTPPRRSGVRGPSAEGCRGGAAAAHPPVLEDWTYPDIESFVEASTGKRPPFTFREFVEDVDACGAPSMAKVEATWTRYRDYILPPPTKKARTGTKDVAALQSALEDKEMALKELQQQLQHALEDKDVALKERDAAMRQVQVAIHGLASNTSASMSPPLWRPPAPKIGTPPFAARSGLGLGLGARRALPMSSPLLPMQHVIQHNKWVNELRALGAVDEGEQNRAMSLLRQHNDAVRSMCVSHSIAAAATVSSWSLEKAALELCRCMRREQQQHPPRQL